MKLRAGVHPVTGRRLPMAIDSDGSALQGEGRYMRLHTKTTLNDTFAQYVPEELPLPKPSLGQSAHMKRQLMLGRIRSKLAREQKHVRRARKKDALLELQELIRTFGDEVEAESQTPGEERGTGSGGCSDEEFWTHLPTADDRREWMQRVPDLPKDGKTLMPRRHQPKERRSSKPGRRCMVLTCYEFGCDGKHTSW